MTIRENRKTLATINNSALRMVECATLMARAIPIQTKPYGRIAPEQHPCVMNAQRCFLCNRKKYYVTGI
jgi:hypothetical protein